MKNLIEEEPVYKCLECLSVMPASRLKNLKPNSGFLDDPTRVCPYCGGRSLVEMLVDRCPRCLIPIWHTGCFFCPNCGFRSCDF